MLNLCSSFPAPNRVFLPGCALAAGLLLLAPTARATPKPSVKGARRVSAMKLSVGKTATYPLPAQGSYIVETGALNTVSERKNGTLFIKALRPGTVQMRLHVPGQKDRVITLELVDSSESFAPTSQNFGGQTTQTVAAEIPPISPKTEGVKRLVSAQVVARPATPGAAPEATPLNPPAAPANVAPANAAPANAPANVASASGTPPINLGPIPAAGITSVAPRAAPPNPFELFSPDYVGPAIGAATPAATPPNALPPQNLPPQNFPPAQRPPAVAVPPATATSRVPSATPRQTRPQQTRPQANAMAPANAAQLPILPAAPDAVAMNNAADGGARISPALPISAQNPNFVPQVNYKTTSKLPASVNQLKARQSVAVTQGEARLLTFQNNILAVFFSDPNVMDARAINARTIAVTGTGAGQSTLAVFTERYPGDAVGFASVYRVETSARGSGMPVVVPDPATVEAALTTALADPRVRVSVVKLPEGTLAARLTGVVRDAAEVQGAITTASFFAPRVLPSIYPDPNAPSIDAVLSGAVEKAPAEQLQDNLRRITGNSSIELISMPGSLVLKAEADSQADAQRLLELLPTLNQAVIPFVTIRGGGRVESSNVPLLQGEDLQLTQKLQAVTGVRTVYAVRASGNSLAIYGTVQDRSQYQAVKRYGTAIAQSSAPAAQPGAGQGGSIFRPQGIEPALAAYDPTGGYARVLGVQMFVRILDPEQAVIRNVTIETNIVEITRTNLKNLGAEYGSATLTNETVVGGTSTPALDGAGNPVIGTNGQPVVNTTPSTITRTISPVFNAGTQLLGNGFAGFGGFSAVNPFRARVNAVAQNNNARVLASPNIRATEGTVAQITIGGERPVPSASASFGSNAQSIEFRRFGVILTMRPTVSDDNTIILQIRADVTQPDQTYAINVGGAIIPGESVRSIDTTLTVRPGDIVVMGGLLTNDKRQQTSKVPILGDLPIIGSLFRSRRFENNETELAIFMSPRIDAVPATMDTMEIGGRIPSFPALPGRQESNTVLTSTPPRQAG